MKKQIVVMFVVWLFTICNLLDVNAQQLRDYVVITSKEMQSDKAWMKVVEALAKRRKAVVLYYDEKPRELLEELIIKHEDVKRRYSLAVRNTEEVCAKIEKQYSINST